jgi:hypothetical protein
MAGYSGTPLWKKLGYKSGTIAYLNEPPANYRKLLQLPSGIRVRWLTAPKPAIEFVHLFATKAQDLRTKLERFRNIIAPDGVIWVSWPKESSNVETDISEDRIRQLALPQGLVDVKVCAVDEVWSGLKLVIRREHRK